MADYVPQTGATLRGQPGHEGNILSIKGLVIFTVALIVTTVLVDYGTAVVMNLFVREEASNRALAPPRFVDDLKPFPAPKLQADPTSDLIKFKADQLARLNSFWWADQKAGLVHVPIEQAIDMLVKNPAPPVSNAVNPVTGLPLPKEEAKK